jgi:hypothetical protein
VVLLFRKNSDLAHAIPGGAAMGDLMKSEPSIDAPPRTPVFFRDRRSPITLSVAQF